MQAEANVTSQWPNRGFTRWARGVAGAFLRRLLTWQQRNVWECLLDREWTSGDWPSGERVEIIGRKETVPPLLYQFLGGDKASAELAGVRRGDLLFVVRDDAGYLACSYIFFDTTAATIRQKRILLVASGTPVIGLSFTAPEARGRGIYKRLLHEMFRYLSAQGVETVVCEVDPHNTASNAASRAVGMRIRRELTDCIFLRRLVIQKVREHGSSRWRWLVIS